ncbi:MAG: ATPase [Saccharofermentans sp.]|nr:ATPase [Saccharofermentans sp.]
MSPAMDSGLIENDLRKDKIFHEKLFARFTKGIRTFDMLSPGDKVAVCISGGKDSMLMAKLFQELKRHDKFPFELVFLVMDPGYSSAVRSQIEDNAKLLDIPVTVFETKLFDAVSESGKSPCFLCARIRRGVLYKKAKELGCNKIALGHHYDDVIETTLMSMLWSGHVETMMPKLHSKNYEGMELIRPMYYIREEDIEAWRDRYDLKFADCACSVADSRNEEFSSKRKETKELIKELKKTNPEVEANIMSSMENVFLDSVISYTKDGVFHSFLDEY